MRLFQVVFGSLVFGMWRGNRYLWFGVRFLTRQTYGCIYGLLGACAEVPTEGGRTCSILCFDLHIPPLLIIVNLNRHYDNCNKVNLFIELDGVTNKFSFCTRCSSILSLKLTQAPPPPPLMRMWILSTTCGARRSRRGPGLEGKLLTAGVKSTSFRSSHHRNNANIYRSVAQQSL